MNWLREAEIKHSRVAMLATLGFWQQQWVTLPGMTPVADSNLAPAIVGASAMLQIIVWMGVLEFWTNKVSERWGGGGGGGVGTILKYHPLPPSLPPPPPTPGQCDDGDNVQGPHPRPW